MTRLDSPARTVAVLEKYGFSFQKKYGQNFLTDRHVLEGIVAAAQVGKEDFILEIGPGIGTLTQYLCEAAGEVLAIEVDRQLIPILEDTLSAYDNVELVCEDVLKLDLARLIEKKKVTGPVKLVANLPYYITTPIIMALFESHLPLESITVMVQKEVADRMQEGPGSKDYGALSLAVQYYARPEIILQVPPGAFIPRPKVGSAVIRLSNYEKPPVAVSNEAYFFGVIRASFNQRRKTLLNGLNNAPWIGVPKEEIVRIIAAMGLPQAVRGETLTLDQFADLSNRLEEKEQV